METFLSILSAVGKGLHWLTGWIVHPSKGGCCQNQNPVDLLKDDFVNDKK